MSKENNKNTGRTVFIILLALVLIGAGCAAYLYFSVKNYNKAFDPTSVEKQTIEIEPGSGTTKIAYQLENAGIIKNAQVFKYKTKFVGLDGKYQAGVYELSPSMTMEEIMQEIQSGRKPQISFTIPEGMTILEIANKLTEDGIISSQDEFLKALEDDYDYDFLPENGHPVMNISAKGNRLEGYLYPETYSVDEGSSAHVIIDRMLKEFKDVVIPATEGKIPDGYDLHQIITLASIVEKECGVDEERSTIAGVFWNRIHIDMLFESNATIEYELGYFDRYHDSVYNTYMYPGLPGGPISTPCLKTIKATLEPEQHDYLWFCLKGDGTHTSNFASTYEDHLINVEIWKNGEFDY